MDGSKPLRGAVLGLGMIGRHHARILQTARRRRVRRRRRPRRRPLRRRPRPRAAVRARSTSCSRAGAPGLRDRRRPDRGAPRRRSSGSPPRASTCSSRSRSPRPPTRRARSSPPSSAPASAAPSATSSATTPRCSPRASARATLGELFLIATERRGPFPARIKDVGVVKDLATHDLDLVRWLGGVAGRGGRRADARTGWAATTRTSSSPPAGWRAA